MADHQHQHHQDAASAAAAASNNNRKEIYTYKAPWTVYAMSWSRRSSSPSSSSPFRLAIGSYIEQYSNVVSIIQKNPSSDDPSTSLYKVAEFDHPYPCTRLQWSPDTSQGSTDLLATTGDYLRLWSLGKDDTTTMMDTTSTTTTSGGRSNNNNNNNNNPVKKEAVLNNNKTSEYCAPLTSFDWNDADPSILGTCSIDTTCTIWDVNTQTPRTQLIAHDREVFDIAFSRGKDVFASVGKLYIYYIYRERENSVFAFGVLFFLFFADIFLLIFILYIYF